MISKSNGACYAVSSTVHISNNNTLKSIYYVYFRPVKNWHARWRHHNASSRFASPNVPVPTFTLLPHHIIFIL